MKIIHHGNRKTQSSGGFAVGKSAQLETRPPVQGGRAVTASLSLHVRRSGRTMSGQRGQRGGRASHFCLPSRRAIQAVFGFDCQAIESLRICRIGEEARPDRLEIKWCPTPLNSNAKTLSLVAAIATKRPPKRFGGRLTSFLAVAQLAATVRPLRACSAATRSTSAKAMVRASVTHLLSTDVRP